MQTPFLWRIIYARRRLSTRDISLTFVWERVAPCLDFIDATVKKKKKEYHPREDHDGNSDTRIVSPSHYE